MYCLYSAMLEPTSRYPAGVTTSRLELETSSLETAVDLSRKNGVDLDSADHDDSEDEAPLDLKVRPNSVGSHHSRDSAKPRFHGLAEFRSDHNIPGPQQLLRIAEMYTTAAAANQQTTAAREDSQERDTPLPSDTACSLCGADVQSPDFRANEHGENLCGRGTISCSLCSKTFALWSHYETHKKCHQKSKQRQYPCQTCSKIFTSASNRNMHQRIHKGVRPFHCLPCGVYFRQKAHLQKHQKTQGHLQATEIWEKKRRDGLINDDEDDDVISDAAAAAAAPKRGPHPRSNVDKDDKSNDSMSNSGNSSVYSENPSNVHHGMSSPMSTTTLNSNAGVGGRSRHKSSPKRKILMPQQVVQTEDEENDEDDEDCVDDDDIRARSSSPIRRAPADTSDDKVLSLIEYNDVTHGYDCSQCDFASHDLSLIKDHARDEHMSSSEDRLRCQACQMTFSKEFNLRIHIRKHETGSQFLPCDHCEQVFKVPNKLIKHMEAVHCICPTCGDRQDDKASLVRHLENSHGEQRISRGFHTNLLQFTPLAQLTAKPPTSTPNPSPYSLENRAAKMRKVDTLAETIRQKKQQLTNNNLVSNVCNGNSKLPPSMTPPRKRKLDIPMLSSGKTFSTPQKSPTELIANMLQLQPQPLSQLQGSKMSPIPADLLGRSENNNVLSMGGLKLPPSISLPTRPVAGMTPPSSPTPPPYRHQQDLGRIHGEVSVTIVRHNDDDSGAGDEDTDAEENTGLDLSIGKSRRNEDHEVTSSAPPHDLYSRLPFAAGHPFQGFPFFGGLPLPPPVPTSVEKSIAEQLLKLTTAVSGLPRPPVTVPSIQSVIPSIQAPELPQKSSPPGSSLSSHYSVLSAMLGHAPYQPAFPGLLPSTPVPQPASHVSSKDSDSSPPNLVRSAPTDSSKPFSCSFCRKEFGHLSSLESHVEHMHSGEAKHVCESCGKNFSSKSNLTAHKKIHSGERPFECAVCHKRFRQKAHLQKHETTHSSATPYQCTVCDKAFGHPSNLNTHMATHSNIRPYHCTDCGKSYKDSASFKRHRLGHTGERPYSCQNCSEAFIDSKALRRHREVVHPAESKNDVVDDADSVNGDDVDVEESDDDGEVSVGRDVDGQNIGEVCDDEDDDDGDDGDDGDEEEEEEAASPMKSDGVNNGKNASSTSAYSSFESNEERGSESS